MSLNADDIASFKVLYLKHFGIELSNSDARVTAEHLLQFFRAVYGSQDISANAPQHNEGVKI